MGFMFNWINGIKLKWYSYQLEHGDDNAHLSVIRHLGKLDDDRAVPLLLAELDYCAKRHFDSDPWQDMEITGYYHQQICKALASLKGHGTLPKLLDLLDNSDDEQIRYFAFRALSNTVNPSAGTDPIFAALENRMVKLFSDPEEYVAVEAAELFLKVIEPTDFVRLIHALEYAGKLDTGRASALLAPAQKKLSNSPGSVLISTAPSDLAERILRVSSPLSQNVLRVRLHA